MRSRLSPAETFTTLPSLSDPAQRRATWRQVITALGRQADSFGVSDLEQVDVGQLVQACRTALQTGLADDLDWIAPGAATLALYELTTALPAGDERREFGRRVFKRVYGGTAVAFTPVAARMAWSSVRQLESPAMKARVALCLSLPIGAAVNADPMALALVGNRERFERWVMRGATGALPARRLAAILYERACREAARRAQLGDRHWVQWLTSPHVKPTFERLLADREPLVWRHAATARGTLAAVHHGLREEIDLLLDPALGPTEWRRAAVSLVACIAHDPATALSQCKTLLRGDLARLHPGLPLTFFWGLAPVIEADPDAAEDLLMALARHEHVDIPSALAALLDDVQNPTFAQAAVAASCERLAQQSQRDEMLLLSLRERAAGVSSLAAPSVRNAVLRALNAFENEGALPARAYAVEAITQAHRLMAELEQSRADSPAAHVRMQSLLADLDRSVLHTGRLPDLLLLGMKPTSELQSVPELENLYDRIGTWVLRQEADTTSVQPLDPKTRQNRLVALLHLLDVQTSVAQDDETAPRVRRRLRNSIRVLLGNLRKAGPASHRVMCAALARSFDAGVREGVADASDLVLTTVCILHDAASVRAIMEGSTHPDVRVGLAAYATYLELQTQVSGTGSDDVRALADGFSRFCSSLGVHGSHRGETLRQCALKLGRSVQAIAYARSLVELADDTPGQLNAVEELEDFADAFERLSNGALRRVLERTLGKPTQLDAPRLSEVVARHASSGERVDGEQLDAAIHGLADRLAAPVRTLVVAVAESLKRRPPSLPSEVTSIPHKPRVAALPDWLLPRRTIGAFYVVSSLGAGGVSSVFIAKRIEERKEEAAELYALKVPQYDPTTARSLSEQEFLEMFRDEAGALLSLPRHTNLARFVNFDIAAKPKPMLVMELIPGQSLEKASRSSALTMELVLRYLDGLLAGLAAMHAVGVAHLDVKPSNVILRDEHTPVLVDFGLSGRQLRPGCGTLEYCAPEVLGVLPDDLPVPQAVPADMYAFACTAYEVLTGQLLFNANDETAIMALHVSHDGWPEPLVELAHVPGFKDVAVVLAACLRRDPRARPTAVATRTALRQAAQRECLAKVAWPVRPESYVKPRTLEAAGS